MKKFIPLIILMFMTCRETVKITDTAPEKCIPRQEICNNFDDDCDKIIDNEDQIGVKPCYSGDTSELINGVCRFGVARCIRGKEVCIGEIKPQQEICNGFDDNCNGQVDEGFSASGLDIVFAIDYSGSMSDKIQKINGVVSQWSNSIANKPNVHLALIAIPSYEEGRDATVEVLSNFTNYYFFNRALQDNKYAGANGNEPSIDAIYKVSDPTNPLGLNWTVGYTKTLFVFTDEWPQSFTNTPISENEARNMAINNSIKVFIFTDDPQWNGWETYLLTNTSAQLTIDIEAAILKTYCQ